MMSRYELGAGWLEVARAAFTVASDALAMTDALDLAPEDVDGAPLIPRSALLHRDRCVAELHLALQRVKSL